MGDVTTPDAAISWLSVGSLLVGLGALLLSFIVNVIKTGRRSGNIETNLEAMRDDIATIKKSIVTRTFRNKDTRSSTGPTVRNIT